ncbi:hypothetical protein LTS08_005033 [Lithohypha guttulata]|uniref:uncharacterized protein n=1 Tax=Lithohypha guttulata TaxID=1690604 RepID=UPI002DDF402D|nr:hypothetical protein LTR51_005159 [Lithohypha guttulata]KAK5101426.1 hypothetical protein LTS08_005033 [Lithohypha guttulata]
MAAIDKNWAQQYINDPLTAPDPSDETGLNASFQRPSESASVTSAIPVTPTSSGRRRLSKTNPFRDHGSPKETSSTTREVTADRGYPSPPASTSPRHSPHNSASHRQEFMATGTRPRRSSSLRERYPGDPSVRPLDQLAKEKAEADRAKHITRKHAVRPDLIDTLDESSVGHYHHEGPYDATLFARNNTHKSSPVAAVSNGNQEALRATPHERIVDSVRDHRPLDGVAAYPPGTTDPNGQTYRYIEGDNMMIEENAGGGPYKRWPGLQYDPNDIKGKGEPSYSIEKALKEHNLTEKDNGDIEMTTNRDRSGSGAYRAEAFADESTGIERRASFSNRLRKGVGSLKKKF